MSTSIVGPKPTESIARAAGPDYAARLAAWLDSDTFRALMQDATGRAALVVLDTIAAVVSFDEDDTFAPYTRLLTGGASDGSAVLFATGEPVTPLVAASVNGAQANASLLSEGHRRAGGHAAAHIVPAVLAAAQSVHGSGHRLLHATIVGYEVAIRVREIVGPLRGPVSPNGNWGAVGAAAGVAWLLSEGDPEAVRQAINTAAALAPSAPMSFGHEGTEAYRHFVGTAAELALTVGAGAAQGWSAPAAVLEGEYALRSTGHSVEHPAPDWSPADPVAAITENYFKRHAVCAHLSSAGDAALELHENGSIDPSAIVEIDVRCGVGDTCDLNDKRPDNRFAARYSLPVVAAAGIVHGAEMLSRFPASLLQDELVLELAGRTTTRHDPALLDAHPDGRPVVMRVRLQDGAEHVVTIDSSLGDARNPLDPAQIKEKVREVLARTRGAEVADAVLAAGDALLADASVDVLTDALVAR